MEMKCTLHRLFLPIRELRSLTPISDTDLLNALPANGVKARQRQGILWKRRRNSSKSEHELKAGKQPSETSTFSLARKQHRAIPMGTWADKPDSAGV